MSEDLKISCDTAAAGRAIYVLETNIQKIESQSGPRVGDITI